MRDEKPTSGVIPATPEAEAAVRAEGKQIQATGSAFLHGEDAWLYTEDQMCMLRFPEEAIAAKKSEITGRADDDFVQLLAGREQAVPVKPSILTTELRVRGEKTPTEARKIGKALVMDCYIHAARVHGEVTWHGTDEYSPVYATNPEGAIVMVLFPFTPVPKSKA
jgi:hypothetical protein